MRLPRRILLLSFVSGFLLWSCSSTPGESAKTTGSTNKKEAPPSSSPAAPSSAPAAPSSPPSTAATAEPWKQFTGKIPNVELVDRFIEASRLMLGLPYVNGPLGEGDAGGPDPEPRYSLTRVDCVTFLEESLALAIAASHPDRSYVAILDAIRYRDGNVGFASRNHYMMLDWIPSNKWLLEDVTEDVVPNDHTRKIVKEIDRAAFLRDHGVEPRPGIDKLEKVEIELIPITDVRTADPGLRPGDLVLWVAKKEGIDIAHTGMVVRNKEGALVHRHGSSKAGVSLDEPFFEYADRVATVFEGIVVLRLKPAAIPPSFDETE